MIITLAGIVAGFFFFCFLIFISILVFSPNGYEDEDGFHYAQPVFERRLNNASRELRKASANEKVKTTVP